MDWTSTLSAIASIVPPQYQHAWITFLSVISAVGIILKAFDGLAQFMHLKRPDSRFWLVCVHLGGYLLPRWPRWPPPAPGTMAAKLAGGGAITKGFVRLPVLAALGLAAILCSCATWSSPTFTTGPSLALTEVNSNNPHPFQVASSAGWMGTVCDGDFAIAGKDLSIVCLSAVALGNVSAPNGSPAGAVQVGPQLGLANNVVSFGPLFTPYAADGSGFLQAGRPGTAWGLNLNLPFGIGPYAPPAGIPGEGLKALPRWGTLYLP